MEMTGFIVDLPLINGYFLYIHIYIHIYIYTYIYIYIHIYIYILISNLVGGLEHHFLIFHSVGKNPSQLTFIFFKMVKTTNQHSYGDDYSHVIVVHMVYQSPYDVYNRNM